jgi:transmembrane sensor
MPARSGEVREEAIGWVLRLREAGPADWEAFMAWLEAEEAHGRAYEEVAAVDRDMEPLLKRRAGRPILEAPAAPALAAAPRRSGRRAFLGWGIAASLVATVVYGTLRDGDVGGYAVETAARERRTVTLADGSRIDLNGGTRVLLDRDAPRFAVLERGEALFSVVHDETAPFTVEAGGALLRDHGTVFNVVHSGRALEVGVAEGAVLFNPEREAVNLSAGMTLRREQGRVAVARADAEAIGAWRGNRLSYTDAPVSRIAEDLSRNLGVPVRVSAGAAARKFSGVIKLDGDPDRVVGRAAALLELEARAEGHGWLLTSETGATR